MGLSWNSRATDELHKKQDLRRELSLRCIPNQELETEQQQQELTKYRDDTSPPREVGGNADFKEPHVRKGIWGSGRCAAAGDPLGRLAACALPYYAEHASERASRARG